MSIIVVVGSQWGDEGKCNYWFSSRTCWCNRSLSKRWCIMQVTQLKVLEKHMAPTGCASGIFNDQNLSVIGMGCSWSYCGEIDRLKKVE